VAGGYRGAIRRYAERKGRDERRGIGWLLLAAFALGRMKGGDYPPGICRKNTLTGWTPGNDEWLQGAVVEARYGARLGREQSSSVSACTMFF
jgi:hypothetical protein